MSRILVIEDEVALQENIAEILGMASYQVVCASDGQVGIQLVKDQQFDLILCDISMPALDGYEVLMRVRSLPGMTMMPFIFLTARVSKPDMRYGMDLGADDYLTKPFTRADLLNAVETRLSQRIMAKKHYQQKLDDLRSNISASLPHELLTPLNGIIGLSEYLAGYADSVDATEVHEVAHLIHQSALRFQRVIQNTLLYANLNLRSTTLPKALIGSSQSCEQCDLIIKAIATTVAQKAERVADLVFELSQENAPIAQAHLEKIVEEVVDNACKFSSKGTLVEINCKLEGSYFVLEVIDQGRGMSVDQIADVGAYMQFDRKLFEQQGSGLGLVIVRQLTDLYNGKLEITSTAEVLTVRISLPTGYSPN